MAALALRRRVGAAKRAGERRSAGFRGYGLIGVAQTEAWDYGVLTETWQKSEMRRTVVHVEVGDGDGVGSRREVATGPPLAPGPLDLARGVPAKAVGGSARPE